MSGERHDGITTEQGRNVSNPVMEDQTINIDLTSQEENEEDEEPRLKYTKLTGNISSIYRNGDDTSVSIVAGDKLVIGTHNGNIHVIELPSFTSLRTYHAHSASITSLSISPTPLSFSAGLSQQAAESSTVYPAQVRSTPRKNGASLPGQTTKTPPVASNAAKQVHIASSSVDGHVCVSSLVDASDVTLRNFARPVQAVALSPEYKYDRTYVSGGLAGSLVVTVGGQLGVSETATTNGAAAAAQGWLGSLGLGANTGKDTVLHSGEGSIMSIKFSRTGRFVAWINEHGIKIMRSHMKLDSADLGLAWKRIAHIDRPTRKNWNDMSGVWQGRIEWINDRHVEVDDENNSIATLTPVKGRQISRKPEKMVVCWGDTAWILHVNVPVQVSSTVVSGKQAGSVDVVHKLTFDDCILSGITLYSPTLVAVLAFRTHDDDNQPVNTSLRGASRKGRHNALSPELRLVDVSTGTEVDVDTLTVSRYERLSHSDYHLSSLYIPPKHNQNLAAQKSALEYLGAGIWDMGSNAGRIFSSAASINTNSTVVDEAGKASLRSASVSSDATVMPTISKEANQSEMPVLTCPGLKIFIQTPYDCVLAVKRDLSDHFSWLLERKRYEAAWNLLLENPDLTFGDLELPSLEDGSGVSRLRSGSLAEFLTDDNASKSTQSTNKPNNKSAEHEKGRIGELWLEQLVNAREWTKAGQVAGKVLGTSPRWEHWVMMFANADHYDEITPYIPSTDVQGHLPSSVYETVLCHYVVHDPVKFAQLLDRWDPDVFNVSSVVTAIEMKLKSDDLGPESETASEWHLLLSGLAKLLLANGQAREALKCYIRLQNFDAAMTLIKEEHLIDAITDDIPGLIVLRVSKDQLRSGDLNALRESSAPAISLLVQEAYNGIIPPINVVKQLESKGALYIPFIYFYLACLWLGPKTFLSSATDPDNERIISQAERTFEEGLINEGRSLIESSGLADSALTLFAQFDQKLFFIYLSTSTAYSLDKAISTCESHTPPYIAELVTLLAKTGETKRALFLIIDQLHDVGHAIDFARQYDGLWDDLLDYSMDKPKFIRALLEQVGTSVDSVGLVRKIPDGLEIEGLKSGIQTLVRDFDVQWSISEGVAKVLRGEVATRMEILRRGRRKCVKFDVKGDDLPNVINMKDKGSSENNSIIQQKDIRHDDDDNHTIKTSVSEGFMAGSCTICKDVFNVNETDFLIGFACHHIFHLECLLDKIHASKESFNIVDAMRNDLAVDSSASTTRSVGAKIAHAQTLKNIIHDGCPVCREINKSAEEW